MDGCATYEDSLQRCADLLRPHLSFVGHYRPAGNRIGDVAQFDGLTAPLEGLGKELQELLAGCSDNAARTNQRTAAEWTQDSRILAVPVQAREGNVLVGVSGAESTEPGLGSLLLDLAATQLTKWVLRENAAAADRGARHVAALVELTAHLDKCRDIKDGAGRLCREAAARGSGVFFENKKDSRPFRLSSPGRSELRDVSPQLCACTSGLTSRCSPEDAQER